MLLLGQETFGWEWDSKLQATYPGFPYPWTFRDLYSCSDFLANPDSIEALCWGYQEFKFGKTQRLDGKPFWRAFNEVYTWPGAGVMWSNIARMDYDAGQRGRSVWNAPAELRDSLISQQAKLFAEELAILKPHICLFFSGPYYDELITAMLPGCEITASGDPSVREFARLIHPVLPKASARTYHPNFLSRGKRWHYIEAMRALADVG